MANLFSCKILRILASAKHFYGIKIFIMIFVTLSKAQGKPFMAKLRKKGAEEGQQNNTSTKLKPGHGPEQPQKGSKVKAAKEPETTAKTEPAKRARLPKEEPI